MMPIFLVIETLWEEPETDELINDFDSREEAENYLETLGLTRATDGDYWFNSSAKYVIDMTE